VTKVQADPGGPTRGLGQAEQDLVLLGRTLAHPVRVRILTAAMAAGVFSPTGLAQRLHEPLGNVSYHVRWLAEAGMIEPRGTSQRRGAVEHFYATTTTARKVWRVARLYLRILSVRDAPTGGCGS
jgi:DNA-binding transcriptional ArsR family regulator